MPRSALIACANRKFHEWLFSVLRSSGFANIVGVRNEQELLKVILEASFSIVLIDDDQQNFRSVSIVRKFQQATGRTASNFVVMIDGSNIDVVDAVKFQGLALAGILVKPFEAQALQKILVRSAKNINDSTPQTQIPPLATDEIIMKAKLFTAKVVDCDVFVGVSFRGELSYGDASVIKRAFYVTSQ